MNYYPKTVLEYSAKKNQQLLNTSLILSIPSIIPRIGTQYYSIQRASNAFQGQKI